MVACYQKDYPRPQFVRSQWQNLNGTWAFAWRVKWLAKRNTSRNGDRGTIFV